MGERRFQGDDRYKRARSIRSTRPELCSGWPRLKAHRQRSTLEKPIHRNKHSGSLSGSAHFSMPTRDRLSSTRMHKRFHQEPMAPSRCPDLLCPEIVVSLAA